MTTPSLPRLLFVLIAVPLALARAQEPNPADITLADFEGATYGDWRTDGTAFGSGPTHLETPGSGPVFGIHGKGYASSANGGDDATGTLTSPSFKIERKNIKFLIGGGGWPGETCLNLLVDGKVVRTASGDRTTQPPGPERMQDMAWDVSDLEGKDATIQIVDQRKGAWGHISVDNITECDNLGFSRYAVTPGPLDHNVGKDIAITKNLLNFPVKTGMPTRSVAVTVDGVVTHAFDIDLGTSASHDWWAQLDVSAYKGKTIKVTVNNLPQGATVLDELQQSDSLLDADNLYKEPLRPQFHFTAQRGWINDSVGLVYYNNQYHLFFEHNPFGWSWGSAQWGHAVSPDMVHWKQVPEAISSDAVERGIWSGSSVVDTNNTSGFGANGKPPLVALYASVHTDKIGQSLAYSTDGLNFTKYSGNPVLPNIVPGNRDPHVLWYEPKKEWVMVLYEGIPDPSGALDAKGFPKVVDTSCFFTSPDLKQWTPASQFPSGLAECPDFFELPVDGNPNNTKWVLTGANTQYYVGSFDGKKFTAETPKLPGHMGGGMYAAQHFYNEPKGRIIRMAWGQIFAPNMPWNGMQTLPCELKLHQTPDGPRMTWAPIDELQSLRDGPDQSKDLANFKAGLVELRAEFEPTADSTTTFTLRGAVISYDAKNQRLVVAGHGVPAPLQNGKLSLIVYQDRTVLDVFASDGLVYVPMPFTAKPDDQSVSVDAGGAKLDSLEVYRLKSIWNQN